MVEITTLLNPQKLLFLTSTIPPYFEMMSAGGGLMRCSVSTDSHYQTTNYGKKSKNFITQDTKNEETSRRDHGTKAQAFFA